MRKDSAILRYVSNDTSHTPLTVSYSYDVRVYSRSEIW